MKIELSKTRIIITVDKKDVVKQVKIEDFYLSIEMEEGHLEFNLSEKTPITFIQE